MESKSSVTETDRRAVRSAPLRNPQFRLIWLASFVSGLGDWGSRIALSFLLFQRSNSALVASLVAATVIVPWLGLGQLLVQHLSAFEHRSVMIASDLLRAALWIGASFRLPIYALLIILLAAEFATVPFNSRRSLAARSAVPGNELTAAVALLNNTFQLTVVLGYVAGAASLIGSASLALRFNALTFLASALLLRGLPQSTSAKLVSVASTTEQDGSESRSNPPSVWTQSKGLRGVTALCSAIAMFAMGLETLIIPFFLHGGMPKALTGVAIAAVPFATIVATLLAAKWEDPAKNTRNCSIAGVVISLLAGLSVGFESSIWLAGIGLAVATGTAFAVASTMSSFVLAKIPTNQSSSVIFSAFQGCMNVSQALGALAIGFCADRIGMIPTAISAMLCCAVALTATVVSLGQRSPQQNAYAQQRLTVA
jgi:Transmembrane secretion effector